jgi:hypothetical protein
MMDMEKLCQILLAKMEADKEEMKADRKADMEEMEANQKKDREDYLAIWDTDRKAWREDMASEIEAWREEIRSMQSETANTRTEMIACQEMEACLEEKELTSVDRKPEVAQQREVPSEDAIVKPVKEWKRRHRGKKRAAG